MQHTFSYALFSEGLPFLLCPIHATCVRFFCSLCSDPCPNMGLRPDHSPIAESERSVEKVESLLAGEEIPKLFYEDTIVDYECNQ